MDNVVTVAEFNGFEELIDVGLNLMVLNSSSVFLLFDDFEKVLAAAFKDQEESSFSGLETDLP